MWQQLVSAFLVELGWIPPPHWASAEEEGQFKWPEVLVGCAQPCPGGLLRAGAHRYHVTTLPLWHVWNVGQDGKPELCVFPLCPEWQDLFLFNIYLFTYWAAPGHSCSMWNLVPWPVLEPRTPAWELGVLATGPPGKSWIFFFHVVILIHGEDLPWDHKGGWCFMLPGSQASRILSSGLTMWVNLYLHPLMVILPTLLL